ncbi:MAG TPA: 50S ribosomal protein L28 [Thermoanaerobaculia bacterium]|nr:50S ribosomal protein L28 [Thermoanaerobaculia bacterium]HUM30473.1 50S ribosomal protein L28 [Thermoanaerobaculia bacterium]HXK68660.1 50S ribosomal protein L28 [Thermoanaerobaculia bacterium]
MAHVCDICGKRPVAGNAISHAHNLTRRRWKPNIQKLRVEWNGGKRRMNVCMRCLRSGKVKKIVA